MRVLIFGASGFIGQRFLCLLREYEVVAVARDPSRVNGATKCISYDEAKIELTQSTFDFAVDFSSHVSVEDFIAKPQQTFLDTHFKQQREIHSMMPFWDKRA